MKDDLRFSDAMAATARVAVMVDGDNLAPDHAKAILARAQAEGRADICRVYCDASHLGSWGGVPGFRLIHSGSGKNATDLLLAIDAMELTLDGRVETFVIASSDRDFAHIAHRLRERGFRVIGMGKDNTPDAFREACTCFDTLDQKSKTKPNPLVVDRPAAAVKPPLVNSRLEAPSPRTLDEPDEKLRQIIALGSKHGKGIFLSDFESKARASGLCATALGAPTWRDYLDGRPQRFGVDGTGDECRVRFIWSGFQPEAKS